MTSNRQGGAANGLAGLEMWIPLIGREATQSLALRRTWGRRTLWVVATAATLCALLALAGFPVLGVVVATCVALVGWALCAVNGTRAAMRATRQAAVVVATSPAARPDVVNLGHFERWAEKSEHVKPGVLDQIKAVRATTGL